MSDVSERACSVRLLFHSSGSETFSSWFSIFDIAPVLFLFHAVNAVAIEKNFYIVRINICWPQSAILLFFFPFSVSFFFFFFVYIVHASCERFYLANSCMTLGHSAFDEAESILIHGQSTLLQHRHTRNTDTEERLSMKSC